MPEGPSIFILKEGAQPFTGKPILEATGNSKQINITELTGKKITSFKSWGKHFLICLPHFTLRIHLLLFGSCLINSRKPLPPRLSLVFSNGEINFYSCSITRIDTPLDEIYDWSEDVMSTAWDSYKALQKLKRHPEMMVCDALLDQHIFSGVGNIIKNEVLFRTKIHPESQLGNLPFRKMEELVKEAVNYTFQFYEWRKAFVLKKHWLVYNKRTCPNASTPILRKKTGKSQRRCFICPDCQKLY